MQSNNLKSTEPLAVDTGQRLYFTLNGKYYTSPNPLERKVQVSIKKFLESQDNPSSYSAHGISNAMDRVKQMQDNFSYISLDIANCFETITYTRIVGLLKRYDMPLPLQHAKYCTFKGKLARGSHCSNYILELILKRLDYRLAGIARCFSLSYSRYIDDLFFFTDQTLQFDKLLIDRVRYIVNQEGFHLNDQKTKVVRR